VSQHLSRKSFFAKFAALIATAGILPKVFAKSDKGATAPSAPAVALQPETRAVARKEGSV
jgi:hypothetical protein